VTVPGAGQEPNPQAGQEPGGSTPPNAQPQMPPAAGQEPAALTAAEQRSQDLAIRLAVERAARKLNFIDEDDAFRLIERSAVEMDAGGDPQNVEALLKDLAKAKPHLVKSDNGNGGTRSVPATGKPGPPAGRSEDVAARVEKLKASGAYSRF
jgi:hypothetical protein